MINQEIPMTLEDIIHVLINYKFSFETLINLYDNVKHENALIKLCNYPASYNLVKMLFDHCKTIRKCKIDIKHCDTNRWNALFFAAVNDINTFKYLLSNKCFPNHDQNDDKNVQIALNQRDIYGNTIAHCTASNPKRHIVDTFKLLKKCNFNFTVYNYYGRLPIHYTCEKNDAPLLSWMIDQSIFDINCQTKYSRDENYNGKTPLTYAINYNSVECVDILCKQTQNKNIIIEEDDIYRALDHDSVPILKLLFCRLFSQHGLSNWNGLEKQYENPHSTISLNKITSMMSHCKKESKKACHDFLLDLLVKGYLCHNFNFIAVKLNYDLKTVMDDQSTNITSNHDEKVSTDYIVEKNLRKGTFGLVQLGTHRPTGDKVVIKHVSLNNKKPLQFITSEIESLKKLSSHSNIIKLLNYQIFKDKVSLYFEYCAFGDLHQLLHQCDHFSMRISFKYFIQLLSAIYQCHKMNIVHRDLKLHNILIDDTFQLKIAGFGLASIVDKKTRKNSNDPIYNVGTPMYKSPELLENDTKYDIKNIIVLKSCDIFSLSIIFWQMMNGIEYLPFQLYKRPININKTKYQYIKHGQYSQFWKIHRKANMIQYMNNNSSDVDLLLNLFEQMFAYNPHHRITVDKILKHEWIIKHENDVSFYINDSTLEAFVRARYHQTQNNNNIDHETPIAFGSGAVRTQYTQIDYTQSEFAEMKEQDPSIVLSPKSESYSLLLKNEVFNIYTFKPLVVMVGIEKYKNMKNKQFVLNDFINVKTMLHDLIKFDLVYQNENGQFIYENGSNSSVIGSIFEDNENKENDKFHTLDLNNHFQMEWTSQQLNKFNHDIVENILNDANDNYKYDGLIYFISSYMKHANKYQHYLYDSDDRLYNCNKHIFDIFNNTNCNKLYKKPKIFILDGFDPNADEKEYDNENIAQERILNNEKLLSMVDNDEIEFADQYKRVIYSNNDWNFISNGNDGNLLINLFCASLSASFSIKHIATNLNDIVKQTHQRLKKKISNVEYANIYDENYIPSRCRVLFTSSGNSPLKSPNSYFQAFQATTDTVSPRNGQKNIQMQLKHVQEKNENDNISINGNSNHLT